MILLALKANGWSKALPRFALLSILALCLLAISTGSLAQAQESPAETPSQQQLQERIEEISTASGIDEKLQEQLLELYQKARERLLAAENFAELSKEHAQLVSTAPDRLQRLQQQLEALPPPENITISPPANATLSDIQQILAQEKAKQAGLQNQVAELERELRQAQSRPARIREELTTTKQRRQALEKDQEAQSGSHESERLSQARQLALQMSQLAVNNHIRALDQELLSNDARQGLLKAQLDLARQQLELQALRVRKLDEHANQYSLTDAAELAKQAAQAAIGADPLLQEAAGINADLSDQLARLVTQLEQAAINQQHLQQQLDQLQARYRTSEQQLEIAGLSQALGDLLRRERRSLPVVNHVAKQINDRHQTISEVRLQQFQLEQELQTLNIDNQLAQLLDRQASDKDAEQQALLAERLRQLIVDRADLWKKLSINYRRYADQLLDINRIEQQLVDQTLAYQHLLDENLFWIANSRPVDAKWLKNIRLSLTWLFDAGRWTELAKTASRQLDKQAGFAVIALLFTALLVLFRPRLLYHLTQTSARVGTNKDHIYYTILGLLLTLLLALPWPLLTGAIGLLIASGAAKASFAYAVGMAFLSTAIVVLIIAGFLQLCRERGIAQVHFRWRHSSRQALRRELQWLLAVAIPVGFLITLTEAQAEEAYRDGLGRLALTVGSISLSVFAWRLLRPRFRLSRVSNRERRHGWWQIRRPLRVIATALPLSLAALALYGYHYTALQLESRFITSGWLLVGLIIIGNLIMRWIRLAQQRLSAGTSTAATRAAGDPGLASADEQARTLITVAITVVATIGLWLIWSDLLPALSTLRGVVLWESISSTGVSLVQVTVGDLILASVVAVLTLVAAGNLPGVLEIAVLHRLNIDPGNRYAISSISRYVITGVGLVIVVSLIGLRWTQVQWLVAALGVGLGFGLQEIFANFISGLVLLFERPIRVGDTITVNEMTGRVSRIRIRATTITDWDRRELIIPNKTFITDRLINWTLSDQVTRIVIKLRIPYSSSLDAVRQILLDCAHDNPRILRDPEPFAYAVGTEDSAFEFKLFAFTAELSDRLPARHELYSEAIRRLSENGIEIPFPQHDLHLRKY